MRADAVLVYFKLLRNYIEKEGVPDVWVEMYDVRTGQTLINVISFEDVFGPYVSGEVASDYDHGQESPVGHLAYRNIRLPNPPQTHLGQSIVDFRFHNLARLYLSFLNDFVLNPALKEFMGLDPPGPGRL